MQYLNISSYKFVQLTNLPQLRVELMQQCQALDLKGTILLSNEGINVALSGTRQAVEALAAYFAQDARFKDIIFKESYSDTQPFRRLRVRIKDEIIKMGVPSIQPEQHTAPHLSPAEFKQWMDEGRDITILDTRNAYEIEVGTFEGAVDLHIDTFSEFPRAVAEQIDEKLKDKPLVMFCTGGVRCEKAGPLLEQQGFKEVYQLDGGILKYLEECGGEHWKGECFVFDDRLAVDENLKESEKGYCPDCVQQVPEEFRHLRPYQRIKVCPVCQERKLKKQA